MAFTIIREDLARVQADAIVVPANPDLVMDGGVGYVVAQAAGYRRLSRACKRLGGCPVGQAVATPAFRLPAQHIIHAVGPVWEGGSHGEADLLRSAYDNTLQLALRLNAQSVALPLLSAGAYEYPVREAFRIAVEAIRAFLTDADMDVTLVLFDKRAVTEGSRWFGQVAEYIDDAYAEEHRPLSGPSNWRMEACAPEPAPAALPKTGGRRPRLGDFGNAPARSAPAADMATAAATPPDLDVLLAHMDDSFSMLLMKLIDARGFTDAQVYKRANISRQHFSKMRNPGYKPTKKTVLALAVALELSLLETQDLLARAGFALSHSSKFDIIVEYFIGRGVYDIFAINEVLFAYDQPLLG